MLDEGLTTTTAKKELLKNTSEIAYVNFISSIRAEQSKKKYAYLLDLYIQFLNLKGGRNELSLLLDQNAKTIENSIISYILQLKKENYSYSTINTRLAAIAHFYTMNDFVINRKKIGKYLGEHIKTIKDRAYTVDEIKKIVDACDLKYKIIVTMMASTSAITNLAGGQIIFDETRNLIWFSDARTNSLGRLNITDKQIDLYNIPTNNSGIMGITLSPDNKSI